MYVYVPLSLMTADTETGWTSPMALTLALGALKIKQFYFN